MADGEFPFMRRDSQQACPKCRKIRQRKTIHATKSLKDPIMKIEATAKAPFWVSINPVSLCALKVNFFHAVKKISKGFQRDFAIEIFPLAGDCGFK